MEVFSVSVLLPNHQGAMVYGGQIIEAGLHRALASYTNNRWFASCIS